MRLDKYLKTARILKRREAAKELALQKRIQINGRTAKPSAEVEIGDTIRLEFGNRILEVRVLDTPKQASKEKAALMFEVLRQIRREIPLETPAAKPDGENNEA
ncbi:RNA-binding S4 domain-containing protein [Allobaculum mucilyticum]|uniref:RNA-binding S4 domain-containing protein n=1 Tax=Allobaculum mucilyticum TaxID=2834459 RepID=UPI001E37F571|nr:RNA-binding S4 domain-containing protein [Allobaculum mucilyticum]UNT97346.1 RNA-binding S4 domain-containing protein [Allobaculum mucilyticum]